MRNGKHPQRDASRVPGSADGDLPGEKKPASTDLEFVAEVLPVPGPFALMRITRLCSQRLLGRNLITVFSTVNTCNPQGMQRPSCHGQTERSDRDGARIARHACMLAGRCDVRMRNRCFKGVSCIVAHGRPCDAACKPAPGTQPCITIASTPALLRTSHRRAWISRCTNRIAPELRGLQRRECRRSAGIRLEDHHRCEVIAQRGSRRRPTLPAGRRSRPGPASR